MNVVGTIELTFANLPPNLVWEWADRLMRGLDQHQDAIGPMIEANRETGTMECSFSFYAVGDARVDIPRALDIMLEAAMAVPPEEAFEIEVPEWAHPESVSLAFA